MPGSAASRRSAWSRKSGGSVTRAPTLPLYGVPFAVKDNIDAAGLAHHRRLPGFRLPSGKQRPAVARLEAAGAILIGKTNLDQFATGLAGTRSPYGAVRNPFNPRLCRRRFQRRIGGGRGRGPGPLALGTDTAGSGRIPAGFNNVVGLKTTRGLCSKHGRGAGLPVTGLCLAIFALTTEDAATALDVIEGFRSPRTPGRGRDPAVESCPPDTA
jgi:allophanate hydrolase